MAEQVNISNNQHVLRIVQYDNIFLINPFCFLYLFQIFLSAYVRLTNNTFRESFREACTDCRRDNLCTRVKYPGELSLAVISRVSFPMGVYKRSEVLVNFDALEVISFILHLRENFYIIRQQFIFKHCQQFSIKVNIDSYLSLVYNQKVIDLQVSVQDHVFLFYYILFQCKTCKLFLHDKERYPNSDHCFSLVSAETILPEVQILWTQTAIMWLFLLLIIDFLSMTTRNLSMRQPETLFRNMPVWYCLNRYPHRQDSRQCGLLLNQDVVFSDPETMIAFTSD